MKNLENNIEHKDKATNILYRKFINISIKYTKDKIETSKYRAICIIIFLLNMKKRQTNPYFIVQQVRLRTLFL